MGDLALRVQMSVSVADWMKRWTVSLLLLLMLRKRCGIVCRSQ